MKRFVPVLIVLLAAAVGALRAGMASRVAGDFLRYHRAGRLVATGRADLVYDAKFLAEKSVYADERVPGGDDLAEKEFKYSPALAVMMAPLGALSPRAASVIWGAWNEALLAAMLVVLWSWCGDGISPWWAFVPLVVLWRQLDGNVRLGQINLTAIVPATIGAWILSRGKDRAAGALVGIGTVVKYMPGVFALCLVANRRWTAFAACAATVVVLGVALPAAVLGPSRSIRLTNEWIELRAHHYTAAASENLPGYSVKSFVYRTLGDTPFITFDEDDGHKRIEIGSGALSPEALRVVYLSISALLVALALWLARRASDPFGPVAASAMFVALPLVSPEARSPHFAYLTLPLTALVCALARDGVSSTGRRAAVALLAVGAFALNATSGKLVGEDAGLLAEAWCAPGWGALAIGVALALVVLPAVAPRPAAAA
jgi:hypothetical protein